MPTNTKEVFLGHTDGIQTLGDVVHFLKPRQLREIYGYEFEIPVDQNPITPAELHALTQLPYEVALTESGGNVILTLGSEEGVEDRNGYGKRRCHSRLSLHTHHENPDGIDVNRLSFADIRATFFVSEGTPLFLVYPAGILMYHAPTYDPLTNKKFRGDMKELFFRYCRAKQYSGGKKEDQVTLDRQFTIDTKVILQEVPWHDTAGIQKMMNIINLTSQSRSPAVRG